MTIQDIRNQLIGHFSFEDTFTMASKDSIYVEKENLDRKEAMIRSGLDELVNMGMIRSVDAGFWVMVRPAYEVVQPINLSIHTCLEIAETIETFFEGNDVDYDPINPLTLNEGHIKTLLQILNEILGSTVDRPPESPLPPGPN